jgi:hypothetical protein
MPSFVERICHTAMPHSNLFPPQASTGVRRAARVRARRVRAVKRFAPRGMFSRAWIMRQVSGEACAGVHPRRASGSSQHHKFDVDARGTVFAMTDL